jgi:predicted nucleic acid-binding Zn finger protein
MKRLADIIEGADEERLEKALAGLSDGTYKVSALEQKKGEIRAYISDGNGKDYGVAINESEAFCHCPDYFFTNEGICKHILMLSLALLSKTHHESLIRGKEIKKKKEVRQWEE